MSYPTFQLKLNLYLLSKAKIIYSSGCKFAIHEPVLNFIFSPICTQRHAPLVVFYIRKSQRLKFLELIIQSTKLFVYRFLG